MTLQQQLLLVVLAAIWGASFLFMRIATPEFGPFALIAIRVFTASLVLLPIWYWRESIKQAKIVRAHWRSLLVVGLFNSAIPFVLFAFSTLYVTGGLASIMNSTATFWTVVVGWFWLGRKPTVQTMLGLVLGMFGVGVLLMDSIGVDGASGLVGVGAAALAALMYGYAANYSAVKLPGVSALSIATFSLVAASIALLPFALFMYPQQPVSIPAWAAVLAMGVLSTALANIIYFYLLAAIGPNKTVTVTFLIPVFGTLWGVLFIEEQVTTGMLIGGGIILSAVALVLSVVRFPSMQRKAA